MAIALKTKELREERNMTQMDLALELELGNTTIQQYEAGTYEPSLTNLIRIADLFGVTVDYLIGRTPIRGHVHSDDEKLAYRVNTLKNEKAKKALLSLLEEVKEYK